MVSAMKVFIDSGILIEYEKQTKTELLEYLIVNGYHIYINPVVVSEYLYKLLGIIGGRSPLSIRESGKINDTLSKHDTKLFLSNFEVLPIPDMALPLAVDFMSTYNMLPNDAIILASCKLQNVDMLASHDKDFTAACIAEGIKLIANFTDLI
jgi:predicted nucleic acid-binding protein